MRRMKRKKEAWRSEVKGDEKFLMMNEELNVKKKENRKEEEENKIKDKERRKKIERQKK